MHVTVITGASSGIGEEFAVQLAARKHNLVLIARSEDKLRELATELSNRYGIHAVAFPCDLSQQGAAQQVHGFIKKEGLQPRWLINNAGFGKAGSFDTISFQDTHDMMMLNMVALVELTHLLLPDLRLTRGARIINVASTASFQPVPLFNVYAATKTFVVHFSEALSEELRGTDVRVLASCPGPTPTNFHVRGEMKAELFNKGQSAAEVVEMSIRASEQGRALLVTQRLAAVILLRFLPRFVVRFVAGLVAKRMMARNRS